MQNPRNKHILYLTQGAIIAALYIALTFLANAIGLASQAIQVRFSEALCVLPYFTPAAIPGLFIGCLLANLLTGAVVWDILFGSLATLLAAIVSYLIRRYPLIVPLPAVLFNAAIVPFILAYAYGAEGTIPFFMATVGLGELISCYLIGLPLLFALRPYRERIFPN